MPRVKRIGGNAKGEGARLRESSVQHVDAVLGADLHLREDCPVCRTDGPEGYWKEQEAAVSFIRELCGKHDCPFLVAGDVFHHWKPSPCLLAWALRELPADMLFIAGQHDLPQHNLELFDRSGCAVLDADGTPEACLFGRQHLGHGQRSRYAPGNTSYEVHGFDYGEDVLPADFRDEVPWVALTHQLIWEEKPPFPGAPKKGKATQLLRKHPGYALILTGDNHEPFVIRKEEINTKPLGDISGPVSPHRLLVNPGSMMRMTAAQADHRPRVYLWDATANMVEPAYLPITEGVVSREHIDERADRDERIEAFVARLTEEQDDVGLDFVENLERTIAGCQPELGARTEELVWEACEQN